jgi:hypothetical protein
VDCERETTSQHYQAEQGGGFGPVCPDETVLLAVFQSTAYDAALQRLEPKAFKPSQLKNFEFSVARRAHTGRSDFDEYVIAPAQRRGDPLIGIASAQVGSIKDLMFVCPDTVPNLVGRAVCLLDLVEQFDHDGHASLGYSESQYELTEKQKKNVRARIHADLADLFGGANPIDQVAFGS